ncbi:MAG: hypothetical protein ACPL88_06495, partial [Bryobacteraceae bacterium]
SEKDYVRIAVELASDLERLTRLRATLREQVARSTLTDATRFTPRLEEAYRAMGRRWVASTR